MNGGMGQIRPFGVTPSPLRDFEAAWVDSLLQERDCDRNRHPGVATCSYLRARSKITQVARSGDRPQQTQKLFTLEP
jgi:hypothetical protein